MRKSRGLTLIEPHPPPWTRGLGDLNLQRLDRVSELVQPHDPLVDEDGRKYARGLPEMPVVGTQWTFEGDQPVAKPRRAAVADRIQQGDRLKHRQVCGHPRSRVAVQAWHRHAKTYRPNGVTDLSQRVASRCRVLR